MKDEIKDIKEGHGLGILKFGMTMDQVRLILGKADETEKFSYSGDELNMTESWDYLDLGVSLNFDEEEDWRLIMISVSTDYYQLNGESLIGQSEEKVITALKTMGMEDIEVEDCSSPETPDHKLIEIDEFSLNFWFHNGTLDEIQWSPNFTDDDSIKWP